MKRPAGIRGRLGDSLGVYAVLAGVAARFCALGLTASAAWLIARAAQRPSLAALGLAIVAVRAFASSRGVFSYLERLCGHDAALRRITGRRVRLYRALARDPAPGGVRDGAALTHMVGDLDLTQDMQLRCVLPGVLGAITGVSAVALCAVLHPLAAVVVAGGVLAAGVVLPVVAALAARRLGGRAADVRADLAVRILDLDAGHDELEVFGAREPMVAAADRAARELSTVERRSGAVAAAIDAAGIVVQGVTAAGVALVVGGADAVLCAVLVLTALVTIEAVLPLPAAAQLLVEIRPALRRLRSVMAREAGPEPGNGQELGGGPEPGDIVLRDFSVHYGAVKALDKLDLHVAAGRSVAVCGESGAGKSTLLAALAGLVPPAAGLALLRPARGLYQDAHLFGATIRTNLLMARPGADDAEIRGALRQAGLDGRVDEFPEGLDTRVGEGGIAVSGGERTRLLLARALLADPEVLLLDEPTEALDPDAGRAVLARVLAERRGRTTIVVTHREDVLDLFDDLVVVAGGRIEHAGPARRPRSPIDRLVEAAGQPPETSRPLT